MVGLEERHRRAWLTETVEKNVQLRAIVFKGEIPELCACRQGPR